MGKVSGRLSWTKILEILFFSSVFSCVINFFFLFISAYINGLQTGDYTWGIDINSLREAHIEAVMMIFTVVYGFYYLFLRKGSYFYGFPFIKKDKKE
jgi:hypothetical protein